MYVHTCFQTPFCPQTNTISQGVFYFYGGTNVAALILIFLFVPETKQFTLEQLDYVFGIRTRRHIHYQFTQSLPYFIKRWIFWNRKAKLEPLYQMETSVQNNRSARGSVQTQEKNGFTSGLERVEQ